MSNAAHTDLDESARADSPWARTQVALVRSLMDEIVRVEPRDPVCAAALQEQLDEEWRRLEGMLRDRASVAPISGVHATESDRSMGERPR